MNVIAPFFYKDLIDIASQQFSQGSFLLRPLLVILGYVAIMKAIAFVTGRLGNYWLSFNQNSMLTDIHALSFSNVARQTYHFFSNNFTGTLVNKASNMSHAFKEMYNTMVFGFFLLFLDLIVSSIILWKTNTTIAGVFVGMVIFLTIFSVLLSKKKATYQIDRAAKNSKRTGILSDIFTNILNVQIFAKTDKEEGYYGQALNELGDARLRAWFYADHVRVMKNVLFFFFEVGIMGVSIYLFVEQKISVGTLVLVQAYTMNMLVQAWSLEKALTNFVRAISDSIDSIDVLTAPILIEDPVQPEKPGMKHGAIALENISFTYPQGDHVFENFSLHIPSGQSVGIVGKSGSGKTTITKLLLRFYDIDSGAITIDNQDIRDVRQDDLRRAIAYIPQESILFHRSIKENIGYSKDNPTDAEVIQASKFAHADEFIEGFEHGYDTKVGERGVKLSGGQRQRVAIARAMLKNDAPVLIMDEATSSLDTLSEQYIQDSFEKLMKGKTTIVIAHRLSTIQKMDRIIVLDKGELVEDGSHEELLEQGGYYAELWNSQTDGFIQE